MLYPVELRAQEKWLIVHELLLRMTLYWTFVAVMAVSMV